MNLLVLHSMPIELPTGIGHICARCITRIDGHRIGFYPSGFEVSSSDDYDRIDFNGNTPIFTNSRITDEQLKLEMQCVLCFGLLYCDHPQTDFAQAIRKAFMLGWFEGITGDNITMEVVLPVNLVFREYCFRGLADFPSDMIELKDAFRALFIYCVRSLLSSSTIPEINTYLSSISSPLPICPPASSAVRPFSIRVELSHPDTNEEVEAFRVFNRANFIRSQQGKRRRFQFPPIAAATIQTGLQNLSKVELEAVIRGTRNQTPSSSGIHLSEDSSPLLFVLQSPASGPGLVRLTKCEIKREYTHLTGSYIKLSRQVSQCPWKKRPEDAVLLSSNGQESEAMELKGESAPIGEEEEEENANNEHKQQQDAPKKRRFDKEDCLEDDIEGVVSLSTYQAQPGEFAPKPCTVFIQDSSVRDPQQTWKWSVEGVIHKVLQEETGCERTNMVASGREDVDVRMLGHGRGFALELLNCRRASSSAEWLQKLENRINEAGEGRVLVRNLKWAPATAIKEVHMSSETHRKVYRAVVWTKIPLSEEILLKKLEKRNIQIKQNTPVRVLHRRSALIRPRMIYWMKPQWINDNFFVLTLETQAGTYIKEFVHGDLGRTTPSVREILGSDADILQLDVQDLVG